MSPKDDRKKDRRGSGEPTDPATPPPNRRKRRDDSDPRRGGFLPQTLDKSIIAIPLLDMLDDADAYKRGDWPAGKRPPKAEPFDVIIDLNLNYADTREEARDRVFALLKRVEDQGHFVKINEQKTELVSQYIFARISGDGIRQLVRADNPTAQPPDRTPTSDASSSASPSPDVPPASLVSSKRAIYRIWPDFEAFAFITKSVSTVKADAARSSFSATGEDIVWAVIDSGIDEHHPHFVKHQNLKLTLPLRHFDFSIDEGTERTALIDEAGHGTHVAGIIAGEISPKSYEPQGGAGANPSVPVVQARALTRHWNEHGDITYAAVDIHAIAGMAPRCKLVSIKVLDKDGKALTSSIIAAIAQIQKLNGYGRRLMIHGVNLSVGYDFQPEWFACGQSPLCVEVDMLVRSGVVVVVSSGNTGYGFQSTKFEGTVAAGMDLSINDPGNAELAITVGATHRDMPHTYGVSYFSSKGPTGDGRMKPDLVAPGEKVISCAAGKVRDEAEAQAKDSFEYAEQSGTSMAAPHVSGVIAAFLSVRREFIGQPEAVKRIFMNTATDLKRDRYFQGAGLVDLMRAIQSV
jgi:serine protease AprX